MSTEHSITMHYDIREGARHQAYGKLWEVVRTEHYNYGFTDFFTWYLKEVQK